MARYFSLLLSIEHQYRLLERDNVLAPNCKPCRPVSQKDQSQATTKEQLYIESEYWSMQRQIRRIRSSDKQHALQETGPTAIHSKGWEDDELIQGLLCMEGGALLAAAKSPLEVNESQERTTSWRTEKWRATQSGDLKLVSKRTRAHPYAVYSAISKESDSIYVTKRFIRLNANRVRCT